jgi:hypothetical protein
MSEKKKEKKYTTTNTYLDIMLGGYLGIILGGYKLSITKPYA